MCVGLRWDGRFLETAKTEGVCGISMSYGDIYTSAPHMQDIYVNMQHDYVNMKLCSCYVLAM